MDVFWGIITIFVTLLVIWLGSYIGIKWINKPTQNLPKEETYNDLLKRPEWQEKRQEILKRDNYKCCYCGSTDKLCVHHKYYLQYPDHQKVKPWNYPNDALITLCNKCHYGVHKNKQIKVYYKKYDTNS